ncbi:hypothetical protein FGO68_gene12386 [Halteria grandinella]|uniref:Uncharacterized protein n=1 Tax=Halteria grandinella TaxID=5974 RepID=A0A8J8NSI7_HALGN|nr:hypothetical protein FGO68_gene12386 [Halteria grandinella]
MHKPLLKLPHHLLINMGKNKKPHASYHPQHFKKGAGIVLGKAVTNAPSKLDQGPQKRVKAEQEGKAAKKAQVEVNFIDIQKQVIDPQVTLTSLTPNHSKFDFNSKEDFSPDNDSVKVARKFWAYLLNPLSVPQFLANKARCVHVARGAQEKEVEDNGGEEEKEESDSYGSEDDQEGDEDQENKYSYDQVEPMDNMIDAEMVKEYLNGKVGVASADSGEAQPIEYGKHIDIFRYLNGKVYSMNQGDKYEKDYALDMLESQGCWVRLNRAHEWSVSLAKALCLSEELFQQDFSATVQMQKRRAAAEKKYQLSSISTTSSDQFFLCVSGEVIIRLLGTTEEPFYQATLRKGDLFFIPSGANYQLKSKRQKSTKIKGYTVLLTLSGTAAHTWGTFLEKGFKHAKQVSALDGIPVSMPFDKASQDTLYADYCTKIDLFTTALKSPHAFNKGLHHLKARFLQQRQAPQEIIEPNEVEEKDEQEDKSEESDDEQKDGEAKQSGSGSVDFKEVKLCSKNGAYIISKPVKNQTYIYYATQNSRVKGDLGKQKLVIPDEGCILALERVVQKYPEYVPLKTLETIAGEESSENLHGLLGELAFLQVLIVK